LKLPLALLLAAALCGNAAKADVVADLLKQYERQGASAFTSTRAETMWTQTFADAKTGEKRRCSTCHHDDLRRSGKHAVTGNPKRLTDPEHIEKWFTRNCKWTLGRECTPQEKGDFLVMIKAR
jgi:hypothetical protein